MGPLDVYGLVPIDINELWKLNFRFIFTIGVSGCFENVLLKSILFRAYLEIIPRAP